MATFTYAPDWGASPELTPRIKKSAFGDGYEQRAEDGLNPYLPIWNLTFSKRTQAEALAIASWLHTNKAGSTAFQWAPPGWGTAAGETFGTGDGSRVAWQLVAGGVVVTAPAAPTIYRTDWQGTQLQYSTARTNYCPRSQELNLWAQNTGNTVAPNATTAPDGTLTADQIIPTGGTIGFAYSATSAASGMAAVASVYMKNINSTTSLLYVRTAVDSGRGVVNWNGPNITSVVAGVGATSAGYEHVGNGWYRVWIIFTTAEANPWLRVYADSLTTNLQIYAWGAQLEAGTGRPTGYIPTAASAVTRTDYTLSGSGLVTLAVAPIAAATLSWSGTYTFKFICDKWTPAKPDSHNSWSTTATFRQVTG